MFANTVFAILFLAIVVKPLKSAPPAGSASDDEENYYPCFDGLNCALGAEKKAEIKACVNILHQEGKDIVFQMIRDASKGFVTTDEIGEIQDEFCNTEKFRRKEGFNAMITLTYDYFMMNCKEESELCENIQDSMKCILGVIDTAFDEKKCGFLHDMQKGQFK